MALPMEKEFNSVFINIEIRIRTDEVRVGECRVDNLSECGSKRRGEKHSGVYASQV